MSPTGKDTPQQLHTAHSYIYDYTVYNKFNTHLFGAELTHPGCSSLSSKLYYDATICPSVYQFAPFVINLRSVCHEERVDSEASDHQRPEVNQK